MGASLPCTSDASDKLANAEDAPVSNTQPHFWSLDSSYCLGAEGCQSFLPWIFDEVEVLDPVAFDSVASTVEMLNCGEANVPLGACIVFSKSKKMFFLLWRKDKHQSALAALAPIKQLKSASGLENWSVDESCTIAPDSDTNAALKRKCAFLDRKTYCSVEYTVDILNAGGPGLAMATDLGMCVIWDTDAQSYVLLWRFDKIPDAVEILNSLKPPSAPSAQAAGNREEMDIGSLGLGGNACAGRGKGGGRGRGAQVSDPYSRCGQRPVPER